MLDRFFNIADQSILARAVFQEQITVPLHVWDGLVLTEVIS